MGPGPGDYEPYTNLQNRPENLNAIEESHRFEARIPRYHEAIAKDEERKVIELKITTCTSESLTLNWDHK